MLVHPVGLIVLLTFSLSVLPLAAKAPQVRPMPKIGALMLGSPPASSDWKERSLFLQELGSLGWLECRNVTVEYRQLDVDVCTGFPCTLYRQHCPLRTVYR
jgi:hypothetical protein